mgnify:FL=1
MAEYYQFAHSVQGYNHIKANKVCQDASGECHFEDVSIIAVADGHGSDNYIRTDRGSKFAVSAALTAIKAFVQEARENHLPAIPNSETELIQVSKNILARWYTQVENDVACEPFRSEELAKVSEKYKQRYASGQYNAKAYGTTLIAVCITSEGWFGIHIGDGKCVELLRNGTLCEPIPWDEACEQNITTSICDSDAIEEFRYVIQKDFPAAIFIGSDGIDDSYSSEMELHELYRSIFIVFEEHGAEVGSNEVRDYLPKITRRGSGDDVSIAGVIRTDLSKDAVDKIKLCGEEIRLKAQLEKAERTHQSAIEKKNYIENNMERNRAELQQLTERLADAEAGLRVSEDALYKAQAEWKSLQARLNALERDAAGNIAMQTKNIAAPVSYTEDAISVQTTVESETVREIPQ